MARPGSFPIAGTASESPFPADRREPDPYTMGAGDGAGLFVAQGVKASGGIVSIVSLLDILMSRPFSSQILESRVDLAKRLF